MAQAKHVRMIPTCPYILVHPALAAHYLLEGRALICVVRHGQTDWNIIKRLQGRQDVPLNEVGMAQAESVAKLLSEIRSAGAAFGTVCSSPLSRASDTADCIARVLGTGEIKVIDNLIERDYGSLAGLTLDERKTAFPSGKKQANDVESVPATAARMLSAIDDMLAVSGRKSVIAVTHGGMINAVYSRLTSGEIGTGKTLTVNCSLGFIAAGIGEPIPLAYNLQGDGALSYITKLIRHGAEIV